MTKLEACRQLGTFFCGGFDRRLIISVRSPLFSRRRPEYPIRIERPRKFVGEGIER